jgi:hypothetical protein
MPSAVSSAQAKTKISGKTQPFIGCACPAAAVGVRTESATSVIRAFIG